MSGPNRRFFGKHRARVVENVDPESMGRLLVEVPSIPELVSGWAMPCVPYAGPHVGFCFTPPIGANVWVEFEGGDPNLPIWVGGFWAPGERPSEDERMRSLVTELTSLVFDDDPVDGGVTVTYSGLAAPLIDLGDAS